ncbi:MAG: flagellar protein FliS [bacterium]|nr:flagellar protein FliS [bacterium]
MDKETLQAYTRRVTQANRSELIVILYELILKDLEEAKQLEEENSEYNKVLDHACKCVNELINALNFEYELSFQLMRLYRYVNECIAKNKVKKNLILIDSAVNTIQGLCTSFAEVAKQDMTGPVMRNTEQVYAGLTYSRGTLNESRLMNAGETRGFQA